MPRERRLAVYQDIENRLRALSGVVAAGRSVMTPISGYEWNDRIHVDSPNAPTGEASLCYFNYVSPGYFGTMRSPILTGRGFDARDTSTATSVAPPTAGNFFCHH
ncbi:MAG: hypothetical protein DMG53_07965 [Acidobacteria bacterium]|nr:MAG: hypothetical protein DMG53_07965 [Acidobacteriota bacterium]